MASKDTNSGTLKLHIESILPIGVDGVDREVHATAGQEAGATCS
jgi:hypothetical protein